ncbi:unnamed protein product [Cladocopium goreaui]|uniref:GTP-binding protein YPTC1 n=1 Tax=Cladocopium goreaui TaxID=2562237 RepID=A0A9P1BR86_9DINO|nr:unnamed protein product [Cladocopium goreaui]
MIDACDHVPIHGTTIFGRSPKLRDVRRNLQGYTRCFRPQDYYSYQKLAESVVWAEILFDERTNGAKDLRKRCVFASATLGLLLCLTLFPWPAVMEVFQPTLPPSSYNVYKGFEDSSEVLAAKEVLLSLKIAFLAPWTSTSAITWPFFALLAILSERLANVWAPDTDSQMERLWKSWLSSGNWSVPDVEAGESRSGHPCDAEIALSAAHAAARVQPITTEFQSWDSLSLAPAAAAQKVVWQCLEEFQDEGLVRLVTTPWATLWRGLDRLTAARDVTVSLKFRMEEARIHLSEGSRILLANNSMPVTFPMSLHPPHILGLPDAEDGYWFLADRIRAFESPHCNPAFQAVAEMLDFHRTLKGSHWPLYLVDIGAHLGDCCLWAASRWPTGANILAVEMRQDHAANIRRASKLAQHPEGVLQVRATKVVAEADCNQEEVSTVDCFLDHWAPSEVHLVSMYLGNGLELKALHGALKSLRTGRLQGVLVRKETAVAIAKAAEVRTELAASQLELTEERQAKRKLNEQTDYLNQLIRKTEGNAASLREELARARAQLLSEAQEADHAAKAARELAAGLAEARASQAAREAQEANLKIATTSTSEMLLRSQEASRRQVASLLASALERLVHRAFHAWHTAKALRLQAEQAQEALAQRRELEEVRAELAAAASCPECGSIYLADAVFCRHCGRKRDQVDEETLAEAKEASNLRKLVESLKQEVSAASREESRELSRLDEERSRALSQLRVSESGSAQLREELQDSRLDLQTLREELQLLQLSRSSETENLELHDELQQARSDCISELQARCEESERCSELESQLADVRQQVSTAKAEAQEARAAAKRHAEEHAREATEVASLQLSLAHAADEAARASASLAEVKAQKNQELAVPSFAAARAVEMALGRREEAARRVLSTLLASQLESLLRQTFDAWHAAKASSAREEALEIKEKEVAKIATELLKSEATQMLMTRKEETLRHWVATLLSSSAETLMLNTFRAWQSAKDLRLQEEQLQEARNQRLINSESLQTLKDELQEALSQEAKLRSLKDEVHEERTNQMNELDKLKDELEDLRSNETKKFKALREELSSKSVSIETLQDELQAAKQQTALACEEAKEARVAHASAEAQVAQSSKDVAEAVEARRREQELAVPSFDAEQAQKNQELAVPSFAAARAVEMALGRREEAARRVLSTLLASQLESLLRQTLDAWRAAKADRLQSELIVAQAQELKAMRTDLQELQTQMKKAPSGPAEVSPMQGKEVAKMATELLKCEASQMLMMRKEEVLRRWVASFLASQTELLLLNMLRAWRSIANQ